MPVSLQPAHQIGSEHCSLCSSDLSKFHYSDGSAVTHEPRIWRSETFSSRPALSSFKQCHVLGLQAPKTPEQAKIDLLFEFHHKTSICSIKIIDLRLKKSSGHAFFCLYIPTKVGSAWLLNTCLHNGGTLCPFGDCAASSRFFHMSCDPQKEPIRPPERIISLALLTTFLKSR